MPSSLKKRVLIKEREAVHASLERGKDGDQQNGFRVQSERRTL